MTARPALPALLCAPAASPAPARELVVGAGRADFSSSSASPALFDAELHLDPVLVRGAVSLAPAAAVSVTARGDAWIGTGVAARAALGAGWFAEASTMAGLHRAAGRRTDLGGRVEFRSLVGIGRRVGSGRLSLAASHMSDPGLGARNPGMNALTLRWARES